MYFTRLAPLTNKRHREKSLMVSADKIRVMYIEHIEQIAKYSRTPRTFTSPSEKEPTPPLDALLTVPRFWNKKRINLGRTDGFSAFDVRILAGLADFRRLTSSKLVGLTRFMCYAFKTCFKRHLVSTFWANAILETCHKFLWRQL